MVIPELLIVGILVDERWLNLTVPTRQSRKSIGRIGKSLDMPYMGTDRCDDATRNYLRENIDKAEIRRPVWLQRMY